MDRRSVDHTVGNQGTVLDEDKVGAKRRTNGGLMVARSKGATPSLVFSSNHAHAARSASWIKRSS